MVGLRQQDAPTRVPSPKKTHVTFPEKLVSGATRRVAKDEEWPLYWFEEHAAQCEECRRPHIVQLEGRKLCERGTECAYGVARLLFKLRADGNVYCKREGDDQEVRVEIPNDYPNVIGLLTALQRSNNKFIQRLASYDSTYYVPSRQARPVSQELPAYNTRTVEPTSPPRKSRKARQDPARNSRGSLYETDQLAIEEQDRRERQTYILETRRPQYHPRGTRLG